jgi:hypothetical protein
MPRFGGGDSGALGESCRPTGTTGAGCVRGDAGARLAGGALEAGPEIGAAVAAFACPGFNGAIPGRATPSMVLRALGPSNGWVPEPGGTGGCGAGGRCPTGGGVGGGGGVGNFAVEDSELGGVGNDAE